jgi:hypothetical protein
MNIDVHIRNKLDEVRKKVQALKDKYDRSLSSKEALQKESDDLEVMLFLFLGYLCKLAYFYFDKESVALFHDMLFFASIEIIYNHEFSKNFLSIESLLTHQFNIFFMIVKEVLVHV